ncbi:NADPH-dependent FMN reductase [Paraburkholderia hospita]|uniref:NADPH-dependent FMN reductase n=1 Tax=Paraburkholderia hospita TaxID=169430 RepID=A0ABN0F5K8_9BURK|nr:NADPH-dependent FMN reductase [Paraburkholderia hospita]OUL80601.1 hypothetical protein CA602_27690 [Paraburkholderia hospita]
MVVHGDVAGIKRSRCALTDWLDWMGFVEAGGKSRLDRFIGYDEPYATSHAALDADDDMQKEGVNVALAVANVVSAIRAGKLEEPDVDLKAPRAK